MLDVSCRCKVVELLNMIVDYCDTKEPYLFILNLSLLIIAIYTDYLLKAFTLFFLDSHPMFLCALFFKVINDIKVLFWFNCSEVKGSLKFEIFTWSKTCQPSAVMSLREILYLFVISTTDNARMLNGWNKFIPFSYPLSNGPY